MKIAVASKNPVKIEAFKRAFRLTFPQESLETSSVAARSGVNHQPFGEKETLKGALNRLLELKKLAPGQNYYCSIEGGLVEDEEDLYVFAFLIVEDENGLQSRSQAARFKLPENLASLVKAGKELGEADDIVHGRTNSKQGDGTVGSLTNQLITRTDYYEHPAILALSSFTNS